MDYDRIAERVVSSFTAKRIRFDTRQFVLSHGREPRGRGSWAFDSDRRGNDPVFSPSMTYQDAKKWAANHPVLKEFDVLYVLP